MLPRQFPSADVMVGVWNVCNLACAGMGGMDYGMCKLQSVDFQGCTIPAFLIPYSNFQVPSVVSH